MLNYDIPVTKKAYHGKLREIFQKNANVTDLRAIDLLVIKVSSCTVIRHVASQPGGGGGGLNLDGWNTRRTPPPLDIVRVTSSIWKTPPLLDIHRHHPPLDIVRVTSSALRKIGNHPPLGHSQAPPPLDIARVTSSTYSKGGTKLLKGGTKSLGWATGGGHPTPPPPPPPGYGPGYRIQH